VQGKGLPLNFDLKILFQFFNTPGTEIAPGSDVVGENFQLHRLAHRIPLSFCLGLRLMIA
jgi:hypothetical protein